MQQEAARPPLLAAAEPEAYLTDRKGQDAASLQSLGTLYCQVSADSMEHEALASVAATDHLSCQPDSVIHDESVVHDESVGNAATDHLSCQLDSIIQEDLVSAAKADNIPCQLDTDGPAGAAATEHLSCQLTDNQVGIAAVEHLSYQHDNVIPDKPVRTIATDCLPCQDEIVKPEGVATI